VAGTTATARTGDARVARLLSLQRTAGNRAVGKLVARTRTLAREPADSVTTAPDPRAYDTFEEYAAAAPAPLSHEHLQEQWDSAGLEGDIVRTIMILGARMLRAEAERLGIGVFRGLHPRDAQSLAEGLGIDPVIGTSPSPPANVSPGLDTAEQTFRHTRPVPNVKAGKPPPWWSPYVAGSDRVSWTDSLDTAATRAASHGTNVARLADRPSLFGVVLRSPLQLLADLERWKGHLVAALETATSNTQRQKIEWDLGSVEKAQHHVTRLAESHTVGHVPNEAVTTHIVERIAVLRYGGYFLVGLSILVSAFNILSAEPGRVEEVTIDEAASWAAGSLIPWGGPMGSYATQSARGEFHPMTMVFPTPFTWMIDAFLGPAMEENDPAGAARIRRSIGNPLLETQMYMDLFRM
jgi:hypothetical protein